MMISLTLVLILLVCMDGIHMYQHGGLQTRGYKQDPLYPKVNDGAVHYNPQQDMEPKPLLLLYSKNSLNNFERIKRSISFENRQRHSLMPRDTTTISGESSTILNTNSAVKNSDVNQLLQSYDRKRNRRDNLKNEDPNNIQDDFDNDKSFEKLNSSSSTSLEEDPFAQATETKEMIRDAQARKMKKYMDTSVAPCDDFYKYACGNWAKYYTIPKHHDSTSTLAILRDNLDVVLRQLLETKTFETPYFHPKTANHKEPSPKNQMDTIKTPETEDDQEIQQLTKELPSLGQILCRFKMETLVNTTIPKSFYTNHTSEDHYSSEHCNHTQELTKTTSSKTPDTQPGTGGGNDAERKAKMLYESCINIAERKKRGIQPLMDFVDSLGGWPVLTENWSSANFDWLNLTARIRRYETGILIYQLVTSDLKYSERNIIHFGPTKLGLPSRDYYLHDENAKYVKAYQRFMSGVMHKLGASKDKSNKTAADMIRFETQLAAIATDSDNNWLTDIKRHKRMTLSDLQALIPEIDWVRYISVLQQRTVHNSEHVIMHSIDYMRDLVNLLNRTHPEIVANYLFWRFAKPRLINLDERFDDIKQTYYREMYGNEEIPPPWKVCVFQVNAGMAMALGSMFVRKYFDENSKKDILKMTHVMKQVFRENLKTIDWLDPETKHLAELKVDAMSLNIGYPDFILNAEKLNAEYSDLQIHPRQYFENTLNVLLHTTRTSQKKLFEPVDNSNWETSPATVNALYYLQINQMVFPAGILQPPFYHRHYPASLKFGGIGVIIGHELTHGFDNNGRQFDHNGSINNWWTNSSLEGFEERAHCIIEQYGNYTVEEVGNAVNGEKTQSENIADNGAIKLAFHAYKKWLSHNPEAVLDDQLPGVNMTGENIADNGAIKLAFHAYKKWLSHNPEAVLDDQLPGVNMTGEQLFFLSFGQQLCSVIRNEAASNELKTDAHTPGRFRTIGTLSNSEDFSKVFNCTLGSPMNPTHKCSLW